MDRSKLGMKEKNSDSPNYSLGLPAPGVAYIYNPSTPRVFLWELYYLPKIHIQYMFFF